MVATGNVVRVTSRIRLRELYRIEVGNEVREINDWRLAVFPNRAAATEFALSYAPFTRTFVELQQRRSLPMRASPSASAQQIYNIGEGQVLKVLWRSPERVEIPPFRGYWYRVLSSDGVQGYAFGRFLREYIISDSGTIIYDDREYLGDTVLENFFDPAITWRPENFREMIVNESINLNLFRPELGLFIDTVRRTISINTVQRQVIFNYNAILPTGANNYFFDGSDFSFTLRNNEVDARYVYNGQRVVDTFVAIRGPLSDHISAELDRRAERYQSFVRLGPSFNSNNWGTLSFDGNNRFALANGSGFVSSGLLNSPNGAGNVLFDVFLTPALANDTRHNFDGVMALQFDNGRQFFLLYSFAPNGFTARLLPSVGANRTFSENDTRINTAPTLAFTN